MINAAAQEFTIYIQWPSDRHTHESARAHTHRESWRNERDVDEAENIAVLYICTVLHQTDVANKCWRHPLLSHMNETGISSSNFIWIRLNSAILLVCVSFFNCCFSFFIQFDSLLPCAYCWCLVDSFDRVCAWANAPVRLFHICTIRCAHRNDCTDLCTSCLWCVCLAFSLSLSPHYVHLFYLCHFLDVHFVDFSLFTSIYSLLCSLSLFSRQIFMMILNVTYIKQETIISNLTKTK